MKFFRIFTNNEEKSYFEEIEAGVETIEELGKYSKSFSVISMQFREFEAGLFFDWHTAPQAQYIVYLEGEVEINASGGETKIFKAGDVLLADDCSGKGHTTKTLLKGRALIIRKN
jgi:quercetin dioxygenase-like cupin family protein